MKFRFSISLLVLLLFLSSAVLAQDYGDVNSDSRVTIVDSLLIAQYYVGNRPSPFNPDLADVNFNNSIDIVDALLVAQYYVGLLTNWPPGETPAPDPSAGLGGGTQPDLRVEGKWIKDEHGRNVVLRGVAVADIDAIYKGDRNVSVKTTIFDIIDIASSSDWKVDVIRLTVHPRVNDETGNHGWLNYSKDDFFNKILDPAVRYVISKKKYAIVDWHYVGESWDNGEVSRHTEEFWNYIAPRYADHPNIIFELFNEPGQGSWDSWQRKAQGWINTIRNTHDADNLIIVGGPGWSQETPKKRSQMFSGGNIVYACHIYPHHGTPNWIEWISGNAPVMMTEWGFEHQGPMPVGGTSSWANKYKNFINSKPNVGWIAWCFDFVYRSVMFDKNWTLLGNGKSTSATRYHGGPNDNRNNYMGQFVKDWLNEH